MSVAARISRIATISALTASVVFSVGGLGGPQSAMAVSLPAATGQSVRAQPGKASQFQPALAPSAKSAQGSSAPSQSALRKAHRRSERARIVRIAQSHIGAVYKFGAEGMQAFDCSGLVFRVFKQAGLANRISGVRRGAKGYYYWFRNRGRTGRANPRPGDLVIWHKGKHIGIYVGNGQVVSALNKKYGVRQTGIRFVSGFTTYLHVRLHGRVTNR